MTKDILQIKTNPNNDCPNIVIIGGGAAGLNLASRLGKKYGQGKKIGKKKKLNVTLVDENLTHIWKPSLHEFAAGTRSTDDEVSFLSHSIFAGYSFRLGRFAGVDRENKTVTLDPVHDQEDRIIAPRRILSYDILVLAIGSVSTDFGVPGIKDNCMFLDTPRQAKQLQRELLNACLRLETGAIGKDRDAISIAIIGGGATGVELAAEIREVTEEFAKHGIDTLKPPGSVQISIVEGAPRLLPNLPVRLSVAVERELDNLGVSLFKGEQVTRVTKDCVELSSGQEIIADLKIWAAGVSAPDELKALKGAEFGSLGRMKVLPTLQMENDESIFAIGDCAECPWPDHETAVPPRAQAAAQQAAFLAKQIMRKLAGKPVENFIYRDRGSLVSIAEFSAVGALMAKVLGTVTFEGRLARWAYISLYQMHLLTVLGLYRTLLFMITKRFAARVRPRLKLH